MRHTCTPQVSHTRSPPNKLTMANNLSRKPLVLLAGWMGCQPRHLRRYQDLYQKENFNVISKIATPVMVFRSCLYPLEPIQVPAGWPRPSEDMHQAHSMQDMAWDVMGGMNRSDNSVLLIHAFSNGGCFLWEHIRRCLALVESSSLPPNVVLQEEQREALIKLRQRVVGVVFDSCPGSELHEIDKALAFCTPQERMQVLFQHGIQYLFLHQPYIENQIRQRAHSYYQNLKRDSWDIPQLYLYSQDDALIPFDSIDHLVQHRQNMFGRDLIWSKSWETSPHCAHLVRHPLDYTRIIERFIHRITIRSRL
jgi:hypothetical protein